MLLEYKNIRIVSYETLLFDTPDGDLDNTQYALDGNGTGYYIRTKPKEQGQFEHVDLNYKVPQAAKKQFKIIGHAYYDEFLNAKGAKILAADPLATIPTDGVTRVRTLESEYKKGQTVKDHPVPTRLEMVTELPGSILGIKAEDHYKSAFFETIAEQAKFGRLLTPEEKMPHSIAYDATSNSGNVGAVSSYAWNHTCGAAANLLAFGDGHYLAYGDPTVTGVTYNGVAMTFIRSDGVQFGTRYGRVAIYFMYAPTTGSVKSVSVTYSATIDGGAGGVVSYSGVAQSGQPNVNNSAWAYSTNPTVDVTTTVDNCWVFSTVFAINSLTGCGNTQRWNISNVTTGGSDTGAPKTPAGSQTMSWTAAVGQWVISAASFAPMAIAAPTVTTQAVSEIGTDTATGNGNITNNGGAAITEKGICYSDSTNPPTTANSTVHDHTDSTGAFTEDLTSLSEGTLYYARAYAINSAGTSYGSVVTFTSVATKAVGGALTISSNLGKSISKSLSSALAMSGVVSIRQMLFQAVGAGALGLAGSLNRLSQLGLSGSLTPAGVLSTVRKTRRPEVLISDVKYQTIKGSIVIDDQIEERSIATFSIPDRYYAYSFHRGEPIVITDRDGPVFAGVINVPDKTMVSPDGLLIHSIQCIDWTYLADKRLAACSYEDKTCGYMVEDLITTYLAAEGVTVGEVQAGAIILNTVISYVHVSAALDALKQQAGFTWWIDIDKKLYFIDRSTYTSPWVITTTDIIKGSAKWSGGNPAYRNTQYIRGGKGITTLQTETRTGDGQNRSLAMGFPLAKAPTITVDAVAQTVGIKGLDTAKDFYWSKGDSVLYAEIAPGDGLSVVVAYYGQYDIIAKSEDASQIAAQLLLEGAGSGIVEDVLDDNTISSIDSAFELAASTLADYCRDAEQFVFATTREGLAVGQLATITYPQLGLNASEMLISAIKTVLLVDTVTYYVTAIKGPLLGSWTQLFKRIAETKVYNQLNVGGDSTLALVSTQNEDWTWGESVVETVNDCDFPTTDLYPAETLFPT